MVAEMRDGADDATLVDNCLRILGRGYPMIQPTTRDPPMGDRHHLIAVGPYRRLGCVNVIGPTLATKGLQVSGVAPMLLPLLRQQVLTGAIIGDDSAVGALARVPPRIVVWLIVDGLSVR